LRGQGKAACIEFYGNWFDAFPDAHGHRCTVPSKGASIAKLQFQVAARTPSRFALKLRESMP
jgi:hypothetical protein